MEAELTPCRGSTLLPLDGATLLGAGWRGALEAGELVPRAPLTRALRQGPAMLLPRPGYGLGRLRSAVRGPGRQDEVAPGALAQAANRSSASSVGDCHTSYAGATSERSVPWIASEQYSGVGAIVADAGGFDPRPPGPVIVQVIDGGRRSGWE